MTITIEINEKLVERMGVEIAEIVDLMDSIGEDLKMLDRRIGAIDSLHDDLVDAVNHSNGDKRGPLCRRPSSHALYST